MQTILYIEDDEANAELVAVLGEEAGYKVLIAFSGKDGIDIAVQEIPDLIICDYHLPYMDGRTIITNLRENDKTKSIPIIMLTADIYANENQDIDADDFLTKPIRRNKFLKHVNRILNPDA